MKSSLRNFTLTAAALVCLLLSSCASNEYGRQSALAKAKAYVTAAIAAADELKIGKGRGPVHHFHKWWPRQG